MSPSASPPASAPAASPANQPRPSPRTLTAAFASLWSSPAPDVAAESSAQAALQRHQRKSSRSRGAQEAPSPQDDLPSAPVTAPGGWGSLLTWRKPQSAAVRPSLAAALASPTDPVLDEAEEAQIQHLVAASSGSAGGSTRRRGAIPFQLDPEAASPASSIQASVAVPGEKGSQPHLDVADEDALDSDLAEALRTSQLSPRTAPAPSTPSTDAYATLSRLRSTRSIPAIQLQHDASRSSAIPQASSSGRSQLRSVTGPLFGSREAEKSRLLDGTSKKFNLDACARRIVGQAGVDFESRPMVILSSSELPDPKQVDYDALLDRLLNAMDLFVENDYTVVFFAAGAKHRPGWTWIWKAYRRLNRKFRKNVKKLYIVHPTFFTRSLVQVVSTGSYFISPKFARKIVQCQTLRELGRHVPLTQIEVPPEVWARDVQVEEEKRRLGEGLKGEETEAGEIEEEEEEGPKVFGVPLEDLMGKHGEKGGVPRVVRDCADFLRSEADTAEEGEDDDSMAPRRIHLETEGIFRRSPSSAMLKAAQKAYDGGHPVNLSRYRDAHVAASLLKTFLRQLPTPLIPASLYPAIKACPSPSNAADDAITYICDRILPAIEPPCNLTLFAYVVELAHETSRHWQSNLMDGANLATVLAPNLVRSNDAIKDVAICRVQGIQSASTAATRSPASPMAPSAQSRIDAALLSPSRDDSRGQQQLTTLGSILKLCIERYYEIFDEHAYEPPTLMFETETGDDTEGYQEGSFADATMNSAWGGGEASAPASPTVGRRVSLGRAPPSRSSTGPTPASPTSPRTTTAAASLGMGLPASSSQSAQLATSPKSLQGGWTNSPSTAGAGAGFSRFLPRGGARTGGTETDGASSHHRSLLQSSSAATSGLGRSASGSLRLTKARLGSLSSTRAENGLASPAAAPTSRTLTPSKAGMSAAMMGLEDGAPEREGLTGVGSGVAVTGASASGFFSSGSRISGTMSGWQSSAPASPTSELTPGIVAGPSSRSMGAAGRRRSSGPGFFASPSPAAPTSALSTSLESQSDGSGGKASISGLPSSLGASGTSTSGVMSSSRAGGASLPTDSQTAQTLALGPAFVSPSVSLSSMLGHQGAGHARPLSEVVEMDD